jgi:peptide-methionine (S)-S-oxide reductase
MARHPIRPLALAVFALTVGASTFAAPPSATAVFAGGCFWSMERIFDSVPGVTDTTSGYTGGTVRNPSYEAVSTGETGHLESVKVTYDPSKVSYEKLLDVYWHSIDPTTPNREFCDGGNEYQSAIFVDGPAQKQAAEASLAAIERTKPFKEAVVTKILPASTFWPAEEYHQNFYKKNPAHYNAYRIGCGRDARLKAVWGALAYDH